MKYQSLILGAAAAWLVGCDPVGGARPVSTASTESASLVTAERL